MTRNAIITCIVGTLYRLVIDNKLGYTGDKDSRKSGCSLCRDIPQKGHKGQGNRLFITGLINDGKSEGYLFIVNNWCGGNLEACLRQHMQNHKVVRGQTFIDTAQRVSLCF